MPEPNSPAPSRLPPLPATVDQAPPTSGATVDHVPDKATQPATPAAAPKISVPGYELLGVLGRGGMGVVYKARQTALKRLVALKMILSGDHADERERTRFKTEAEAVARIQHPNIVQIFEVGEHEGRPYCALELVEGGSLAKKLDGTPWPPRQAAQLLQTLAEAVQAAHAQGIIHRDLKPANILIVDAADQSAIRNPQSAIPKITDFGLAKQLDDNSEQTRTGQIMGTPSYMSPEQALGKGKEVGPATDVYALGVMLYELLTGRVPFKGASVLETLEQVRHQEPVAPRLLTAAVPRDLETVCLKCLDKKPERRYTNAQALADDLGRFARGEPVQARPVGQLERAWRWCLRNKAVAASLMAVLLALLIGTTVSIAFGVQAEWSAADAQDKAEKEELARKKAEAAEDKTRQVNVKLEKSMADERDARRKEREADSVKQQYFTTAQLGRVGLLLEREPSRARALLYDTTAIPEPLRDFSWHLLDRLSDLRQFTVKAHERHIYALAFSPDGKTLASAGRYDTTNPAVKLWSLQAQTPRLQLLGHGGGITSLCWSPDGKLLASASVDRTVRLWDAATGKERAVLTDHGDAVNAVAFSPDGQTLVSGSNDKTIMLWDVATLKARKTLRAHRQGVTAVAFHRDGQLLASGCESSLVYLWSLASAEVHELTVGSRVFQVAFTPDGQELWAANGKLHRWKLPSRELVALPDVPAYGLALSSDGKLAATLTGTGALFALREARTCAELYSLKVKGIAPTALAFRPDGKLLAAADGFGHVQTWSVGATAAQTELAAQVPKLAAAAIGADGRTLVTVQTQPYSSLTIATWDLADGQQRATARHDLRLDEQDVWSSLHGDLKSYLVWTRKQPLEVRETATGKLLGKLPHDGAAIQDARYSPNGRLLGVATRSTVYLYDAGTLQPAGQLTLPGMEVHQCFLSPDGATAVVTGQFQGIQQRALVWDLQPVRRRANLETGNGIATSVVFHPDGKTAAVASIPQHEISLHDLATGAKLFTLTKQDVRTQPIAFLDNGATLLAWTQGRALKLWHFGTRQERATFLDVGDVAAVSPTGNLFLTNKAGTLTVWQGTGQLPVVLKPAEPSQPKVLKPDQPEPELVVRHAARGLLLNAAHELSSASARDPKRGLYCREYKLELDAKVTYTMDMKSTKLDSILRLQDETRREIAYDDDGGGGHDARLIYTPQRTGTYYLLATTFNLDTGPYTLTIRAGAAEVALDKVRAAIQSQQWDQAAELFVQISQQTPHQRAAVALAYAQAGARERLPELYQRLLKDAPNDAALRHESAVRAAELSLWTRAAEDCTHAVRLAPEQQELLFEHLCLRLLVADVDGFKRLCPGVLESTTKPGLRRYLAARIFTLTVLPEADRQLVARRSTLELLKMDDRYAALTVLGALDVRAGKQDEAQKRLRRCLTEYPNWEGSILPQLWLALSLHGQGKLDEARKELAAAVAVMDKWGRQLPLSPPRPGVVRLHLHDWLEAQVLRREVEQLLAQ